MSKGSIQASLQWWKEKEGLICLKIKERQEHNLPLGKCPEFLAHTRAKINEYERLVLL